MNVMNREILNKIRGGIIVSCQALPDEPLYGKGIMTLMAKAAEIGGAVGIRANGVEDIKDIKKSVKLPVIGIIKQEFSDSEVYITPTIEMAKLVIESGADIIALDATNRRRHNGLSLSELFKYIKEKSDIITMADISTLEEGINAQNMGFDIVATTLAGYTSYSRNLSYPDYDLLTELLKNLSIPVIMEGRVSRPEQARHALNIGAYAVVVGSAITRPQEITRRFVEAL